MSSNEVTKCPACGTEISQPSSYCPSCGALLPIDAHGLTTPVVPTQKNLFDQGKIGGQSLQQQTYDKYLNKQSNSQSLVAFVIGILSVVMSLLNYFGVPVVHLVGFVLGIIAIVLSRPGCLARDWRGITGLICGILGLILGAVATIIGIVYALMTMI